MYQACPGHLYLCLEWTPSLAGRFHSDFRSPSQGPLYSLAASAYFPMSSLSTCNTMWLCCITSQGKIWKKNLFTSDRTPVTDSPQDKENQPLPPNSSTHSVPAWWTHKFIEITYKKMDAGWGFHHSCVIKRPSPQGCASGTPHSSRQLHPGFSPAALLCSLNTAQGPWESRSFPSFLSSKPAPRPGSNEPFSSLQEGVFQFRESSFLFVLFVHSRVRCVVHRGHKFVFCGVTNTSNIVWGMSRFFIVFHSWF